MADSGFNNANSDNSAEFRPHAFDPWMQPELFRGVLTRRFFAFLIDLLVLSVPVIFGVIFIAMFGVVTLGLGWALFWLVSPASLIWDLVYYGASLGGPHSATVGMRIMDLEMRTWYGEPSYFVLGAMHAGRYPADYLERVGPDAPKVEPGDFDLISLPTDHLGLNIYTGTYVRAGRNGAAFEALPPPANYPRADSPWLRLVPQSIYWATRLAHECYGHQSLYITENGCGYNEEPVVNGEVLDLHRRDFLRNHLREAHRAIGDGVPLHGYFLWSFIDNFEWEDGYQRRFGIVHCDYATQVRTPKLSARYYAQVMRERRIL